MIYKEDTWRHTVFGDFVDAIQHLIDLPAIHMHHTTVKDGKDAHHRRCKSSTRRTPMNRAVPHPLPLSLPLSLSLSRWRGAYFMSLDSSSEARAAAGTSTAAHTTMTAAAAAASSSARAPPPTRAAVILRVSPSNLSRHPQMLFLILS